MNRLISATGVQNIKQKGHANPLKNNGRWQRVPTGKQRKETGKSPKAGIFTPFVGCVPTASMPVSSRVFGFFGTKKSPETSRAFGDGGGVGMRVQTRSPIRWVRFGAFVLGFGWLSVSHRVKRIVCIYQKYMVFRFTCSPKLSQWRWSSNSK